MQTFHKKDSQTHTKKQGESLDILQKPEQRGGAYIGCFLCLTCLHAGVVVSTLAAKREVGLQMGLHVFLV